MVKNFVSTSEITLHSINPQSLGKLNEIIFVNGINYIDNKSVEKIIENTVIYSR